MYKNIIFTYLSCSNYSDIGLVLEGIHTCRSMAKFDILPKQIETDEFLRLSLEEFPKLRANTCHVQFNEEIFCVQLPVSRLFLKEYLEKLKCNISKKDLQRHSFNWILLM